MKAFHTHKNLGWYLLESNYRMPLIVKLYHLQNVKMREHFFILRNQDNISDCKAKRMNLEDKRKLIKFCFQSFKLHMYIIRNFQCWFISNK